VVTARCLDVAVDLRRSSPRFGRWVGVELSAANKHMLWVPPGFAHGRVRCRTAPKFLYKCTEFYVAAGRAVPCFVSDPAIRHRMAAGRGGAIAFPRRIRWERVGEAETYE
jgi:dTDP-4-dehydrorhamnose 3,5-epimerase-like enzyme